MKQCTKCGETKPLSDYPKDKTKKDGHGSQCKVCKSAAKKKAKSKKPTPTYERQCGACGIMHVTHKPKAARCQTCIDEGNPVKWGICVGSGRKFPNPDDAHYSPEYAAEFDLDQWTLTPEHEEELRAAEKLQKWKTRVEQLEAALTKQYGPLETYHPDYGDDLIVIDPDAPRDELWAALGLNPPHEYIDGLHPWHTKPVYPTPATIQGGTSIPVEQEQERSPT